MGEMRNGPSTPCGIGMVVRDGAMKGIGRDKAYGPRKGASATKGA